MAENFENNGKENELKIKFEEANDEYRELVSCVNYLKLEIASINNKILNFKSGIRDSKKLDKIMYAMLCAIVGGTTAVGLLSSAGFTSVLVRIGVLSLSIPFTFLIQSATYRLNIKKRINDLNYELCDYKNSLIINEQKLIEKKHEMTDKFYNFVDSKAVDDEKHVNLHLKKYEKPYIKVKKINN